MSEATIETEVRDVLNEKLDAAIGKMADLTKAQPDPQKALHSSQAALNLASAKAVLNGDMVAPRNSRKAN